MPPPLSVSAAGAGTSSTVSARTETGWHVLKVQGFSQIKEVLGVGKYFRSGTFTVGGHGWYISCYPDGFDKHNASCVGVDLSLDTPASSASAAASSSPAGDIRVRFNLSLLDHAGEPVPVYTKNGSMCSFSSAVRSRGYIDFIKRTVLESSYLHGDSFQIRCDVTVYMEICTEIITAGEESLAVPPQDLHCHLGALLDSKVGADVTFQVGGEEFPAHRIVLAARSPVFMAELFGPMKEKFVSHVRIDDVEARVFKALLHFIYTDSLPDETDEGGDDQLVMVQHLLVAADKYHMERLKLMCADMLSKRVDSSLVATTLVLAEQHGCHGLKETCFKFLMSPGNLAAAMAISDGFRHLATSCPSVLEELLLVKITP